MGLPLISRLRNVIVAFHFIIFNDKNKMRPVVMVFALLSQSSASFFGELGAALGAVQANVGKLWSDVSHDLRDTYDCTVHAVEKVIYNENEISEYYNKCKDTDSATIQTSSKIVTSASSINIYINPISSVTSKENVDTVSAKSDISVIQVTEKYVYDKQINEKLSSVEKVIKEEYNRVANISANLEYKFDQLSRNVKKVLKMKENKRKLATDKTQQEIEILRLEEELHQVNVRDEIREAVDEILRKLNDSPKESDLKLQLKTIVEGIDDNLSETILEELEKWKEKLLQHFEDIKLDEFNQNPRKLREVATNISSTTNKVENNSIDSKSVQRETNVTSINETSISITAPTTMYPFNLTTAKLLESTTKNSINQTDHNSSVSISTNIPITTTTSKPSEIIRTMSPEIATVTSAPTTPYLNNKTTNSPTISVVANQSSETTVKPTELLTSTPHQTKRSSIEITTTPQNYVILNTPTEQQPASSNKITEPPINTFDNKITRTTLQSATPKSELRIPATKRISTEAIPPLDDYDEFLAKDPKAVDEAMQLIDKSKKTKSIMDAFLNSINEARNNLFGHH